MPGLHTSNILRSGRIECFVVTSLFSFEGIEVCFWWTACRCISWLFVVMRNGRNPYSTTFDDYSLDSKHHNPQRLLNPALQELVQTWLQTPHPRRMLNGQNPHSTTFEDYSLDSKHHIPIACSTRHCKNSFRHDSKHRIQDGCSTDKIRTVQHLRIILVTFFFELYRLQLYMYAYVSFTTALRLDVNHLRSLHA